MTITVHSSKNLSILGKEAPTEGSPVNLVKQDFVGPAFSPCKSDSFFYVSDGLKSSKTLFNKMHTTLVNYVQLMRLVAFGVIYLGWWMMLAPIEAIVDAISFVGNCLAPMVGFLLGLFSFVTALALCSLCFFMVWVFYHPVLGIPLLLLSLGILYVAMQMQKEAKKRGSKLPSKLLKR